MSSDPLPSPASPPPPGARNSFWRKLGGGSLTISITVHALLLVIGLVWIFQVIPEKEKQVDFLPKGGGGGSPGVKEVSQKKQRPTMTMPNAPRMAAKGVASQFTLPEPDAASALSSVGALTSGGLSGGLGGSGSGGGRGTGNGTGFGNGNGPGLGGNGTGPRPFSGMMFGTEVKARSIGVVLDVSGSMTHELPKVVKELDRVAPGSPLILYAGCGIQSGRPEKRAYATRDMDEKRFERFWRLTHERTYLPAKTLEQGSAKIAVDFTTPIPEEPVFRILANRGNSHYIDYQGVGFAWTALVARELADVEAVYWFSDFQDPVDEKEAKELMHRLRAKKQKLYIHPTTHGASFDLVKEEIVTPTQGDVVEVK
ncbi:hypothetical protein [Luteolibacter sp. LG18]|uniref:hypothetical protein n=1 Tax=Luteolibacter sp. LG18 TaxID=2819286 RepID=UPI002B2B33D3|nr:hypothetical protein llg_05640 [Luteolibacter sp. LG18]